MTETRQKIRKTYRLGKGITFVSSSRAKGANIKILSEGKGKIVGEKFFKHWNKKRIPHVEAMVVDPALAESILKNLNVNNRKISEKRVTIYTEDMKEDRWYITHQSTVAFYADGVLADGQHRLRAIIKSGKPALMFVFSGLDWKSALFIDEGKKRSILDVTAISPHVDTVTNAMKTTGNYLLNKTDLDIKEERSKGTYNLIEFCEKHHDALEAACRFNNRGVALAQVRAALARLYYNVDSYRKTGGSRRFDELVEVLNTELASGVQDAAVISLIRHIRRNKPLNTGNYMRNCYRRAENAFHHFMMKQPMKRLTEASGEMFLLPDEMERQSEKQFI